MTANHANAVNTKKCDMTSGRTITCLFPKQRKYFYDILLFFRHDCHIKILEPSHRKKDFIGLKKQSSATIDTNMFALIQSNFTS